MQRATKLRRATQIAAGSWSVAVITAVITGQPRFAAVSGFLAGWNLASLLEVR